MVHICIFHSYTNLDNKKHIFIFEKIVIALMNCAYD